MHQQLKTSAHYRTQLNFTFEALKNAENTLNGIYGFVEKVADAALTAKQGPQKSAFIDKVSKIKEEFFAKYERRP